MSGTTSTSRQILGRRMRTILRQLRKIEDDGFDLDILVELSRQGRQERVTSNTLDRKTILGLYMEALG